ncbi:MAG: SRPBCC domain-containing protein [Actinobacteria bacterium]|nr:SRPBCC domain-containing protein [Actinomycetota bacterium]
MLKRELVTSLEVEAGRDRVWEVLSDLAAYPAWNPMIRRASGELAPGKVLRVRFEPEGMRGRDYRPRLTVVEPPGELRWTAFLNLPGVFEFEHWWLLEPLAEGRTLLKHGVSVSGILAPLVWKVVVKTSRAPFEAMNRAHKERAERLAVKGGGT